MKYDVDYFIKKFEAIPEEIWGEGVLEFRGVKCALGHCGVKSIDVSCDGSISNNDEANALAELLKLVSSRKSAFDIIYKINDYGIGPTPKKRILAALYEVKKLQQPKPARTKTVYVSVPVSITEQAKELIQS